MRGRAPAILAAGLLAVAAIPSVAAAADSLEPRSAIVDADGAAHLMAQGFDIAETGYELDKGEQQIQFVATDAQAAKLESKVSRDARSPSEW